MGNVVLVGFMGTGKTTVGKAVASKLGYSFVDVDDMIEKEQGVSISRIFSELGESYFRLLERDMVKSLAMKDRLVISAGGGAVLDTRNVDDLKRVGPLVCLVASPEEILKRVGGSTTRPLLRVPDPLGKIREMLEDRAPFYALADVTVDTTGCKVDEVAEKVFAAVKARI